MNPFSEPSPYPLDRYRSSFLLLFLCVLTQISGVFAQESGVGTLTGRVTNKATGSFLPGAIISVEGSSAVAIASRDGTFTLSVPAGTRTLIANFTGLDELRTPVAVAGGQTTTVDLSLTSQIYAMDPVAVTGLREGNALAIQTQRNAINSKTVAAVDTFGNPAANPGELLQRLPGITTDIVGSEVRTLYIRGMGPGFSSLMVDGDRMASSTGTSASRDYQIEQLGTGNIESVELIKAPTPDQDANAVAGYVNLISKRAFDLPERRIGAIAGTMWKIRSFDGSPFKDKPDNLDILGVSYSDVFSVLGGSNNLGIAMNVNRRVSTTTQDEIGPGALTSFSNSFFDPLSSRPLQRVFGTGDFGYDAEAHNVGLNVDYKLTPDAYVFFRFALNTNYQYQEFYRPTVGWTGATAATFTPESTYDHSEMLPVANSVGLNESAIFTKKSLNYAFSGGGEQKLFGGTSVLSVRGNYSHANINYPAYIRIQSTASGIGWRLDRTDDPWYPQFTQTSGPSLYDANSYRVRNQLRYSYKAPNDLYGGRIDFKKDFSIAVPAYVRVGVKYARDERSTDVQYSEYTFVGADGIANSADDSMAPYLAEHYRQGDGRYGPFPFTAIPNTGRKGDLMSVPQGYWTETAANAYQGYVLSNSDLKFSETISAAYISGNIELGRLKILAGLRVEETDTSGTAQIRNTSAAWGGNSITTLTPEENRARARRSFVGPFTQKGNYRDVFPGLHFVYEPIDSLLVRASYNLSISRPPVANIIATLTENPDTMTISAGNPDLKPYHSDNFELSVEKYFEPVGMFSAGVFLKEITDYFRTLVTPLGPGGIDGSGLYANYQLSQSVNVGDARIRGFELSYQQQLTFLPGVLRGLGVFANYSYQQAQGSFGTVNFERQLANLPPRNANGGISYRGYGFQVNFLANWTAEKYKGNVGTIPVYNEARTLLDLKIQYSVNRNYDLFLDISNLTDEAPRTDVSKNGLYFFRTNQGVSFVAGVKALF